MRAGAFAGASGDGIGLVTRDGCFGFNGSGFAEAKNLTNPYDFTAKVDAGKRNGSGRQAIGLGLRHLFNRDFLAVRPQRRFRGRVHG